MTPSGYKELNRFLALNPCKSLNGGSIRDLVGLNSLSGIAYLIYVSVQCTLISLDLKTSLVILSKLKTRIDAKTGHPQSLNLFDVMTMQ